MIECRNTNVVEPNMQIEIFKNLWKTSAGPVIAAKICGNLFFCSKIEHF